MKRNPVLREFFEGGFYLRYWSKDHADDGAKHEAEQVLKLLGAQTGTILDWRGGWGRHAIHFAEKGFRIVLLDFIKEYLDWAEAAFAEKGFDLKTVHADCRETPKDIQADFGVCLKNSVGFLEASEEIDAFRSLYGALKPGARICADGMNLFFLSNKLNPVSETKDPDGTIKRQHNSFDFRTNVLKSVFEIESPDGQREEHEFNQTLYTPADLVGLISDAGFIVEEVYGDYDGKPVSFESPRTVVVAKKPE